MSTIISRFKERSEVPTGVVSLYANRIIQQVAQGLLGIFVPVFLLESFGSLNAVFIYYILAYTLYLFFVTPGAILASKITFRRGLIFSVFGGAVFYFCLFVFDKNILLFAGISLIAATFDRVLYWIPYHSGFAKFTDKENRGRIIGIFSAIFALFAASLPLIAGLIISTFNFEILFLIAIVIYVSSIFPLANMPKINEYYSFGLVQTWKILFHKRDRKILFSYMADGAQDTVGIIIWPIFMWMVLDGDFTAVGLLSSLIVLTTIVIQLAVGSYTDKIDKKTLIKYGSVLYSIGWVIKAFVNTGFHIFVVSSYHNFSSIIMRTPFSALMYEKAADAGHYMDEYSVLRSMSINLGRILMLVATLILVNFTGLQASFILAAIAALFINLI